MANDGGFVMKTWRKQVVILTGSPIGFFNPVFLTQNFVQSHNPEGVFWHPTSQAYRQSRIRPYLISRIPSFK